MATSIKTVKNQSLYFGPCIFPSNISPQLINGFEGLTGVADWYKPTKEEIYNRDKMICSLDQWSSQCFTNLSVTQSTETTNISDSCNEDQVLVTKNVRSISFTSNDYIGVTDGSGIVLPIPPDAVRCAEQAYKSKGCLLLPVLWLNSARDVDGARGVLMLATVTQFDFPGGAITDATTFSLSLGPASTPLRNHDQLPMKNSICVTCFTDTAVGDLPDDLYIGEQVDNGGAPAGYTPVNWTSDGNAITVPTIPPTPSP